MTSQAKITTATEITNVMISSIQVSNRAREQVGDITDLMLSIKHHGLLNPIILDEDLNLIAGECRLTACRELGWKKIPARVIPGLTKEDTLVLELVENVARKDFTWAEECELFLRIHEAFKEHSERGKYTKPNQRTADTWSVKQSAAKLKITPTKFALNVETGQILRQYPILKQEESKSRARKAYEQIKKSVNAHVALETMSAEDKEAIKRMTEILTPGRSITEQPGQPAPEQASETVPDNPPVNALPSAGYHIKPFQEVLESLPDGSLGMIEADPPYAIDFNNTYMQIGGNNLGNFKDWTVEEFHNHCHLLLNLGFQKLAANTWFLFWCPFEHIDFIQETAKTVGFKTQLPGAWVKPGAASNSPSTTLIRNLETYLLFRKGDARFNTPSFKAAILAPTVTPNERIHPTEKPLALYNMFTEALALPSYPVFSAFAGSGNVLLSAVLNGNPAIGCDTNEAYQKHFLAKYITLQTKVG